MIESNTAENNFFSLVSPTPSRWLTMDDNQWLITYIQQGEKWNTMESLKIKGS